MQPFADLKQKKIDPPDHVVISETLPLPLVVIHGHFMNPPPPSLTTWYMDAPFYIISKIKIEVESECYF